jgi:hypothetical protein
LDSQNTINDFVAKTHELQQYELSDNDRQAIKLVTGWLKAFWSATKCPMLSSAHAIFRGLEELLQDDLANLPDSALRKIQLALSMHIASSVTTSSRLMTHHTMSGLQVSSAEFRLLLILANLVQVLDPRITYKGLHDNCDANDASTQSQINSLKKDLHTLYKVDYATMSIAQDSALSPSASTDCHTNLSGRNSSSKVNFTVRYKKWSNISVDEFEEYLKLLQEDFDLCDPIQWWAGRQAQFPNLS